jgi:hypothetical protein
MERYIRCSKKYHSIIYTISYDVANKNNSSDESNTRGTSPNNETNTEANISEYTIYPSVKTTINSASPTISNNMINSNTNSSNKNRNNPTQYIITPSSIITNKESSNSINDEFFAVSRFRGNSLFVLSRNKIIII